MSIDSLPLEILDFMLSLIDDVFEFMNISQVCKALQAAVKSRVLVISDSAGKSALFQGIAGAVIHAESGSSLDHFRGQICKFGFYIVEYHHKQPTGTSGSESLIANIVALNTKQKKITRVLLSTAAIESLYDCPPLATPVNKLTDDWMSYVSKTIAYSPTLDPKLLRNGQLEIIGHDYEFINIINIPRVYFHVNEKFDFRIRSKHTVMLDGVSNTSMGTPRLPPLLKFLQLSEFPCLTRISDISIESGLSLKIFERFQKLKELSLESAFTGNVQLQISKDQEKATLENLEVLRITGNAISLSALELPKLECLFIALYGSNERSISQSLCFEDVQLAVLKQLHLDIGPFTKGLDYITKKMEDCFPKLTRLSIRSKIGSFTSFENLRFDNLTELTLKANNFALSDPPQINIGSGPSRAVNPEIDSRYLQFPKLEKLDLTEFDPFNSSFLNTKVHFPSLKTLKIRFKVLSDPQCYEMMPENFPALEFLVIKYANRYGPLKKPDITLKIGNLSSLKSVQYDSNVHIEIDEAFRRHTFFNESPGQAYMTYDEYMNDVL